MIARQPETLSADPFFPAFIAGIETTLAEHGQALLLQVVPDQESERRNYETLAASGRVDGVFLTDLRVDDPRPALLESLGLPSVVIAPAPIECRWPVVAVDDRPGIVAAVEHLVALGHRRIAHVAGPMEFVHSRSRQQAWADTLAASGLEESPCVWSDFSPSGGAHATQELLDLPEPPTAIVYANDLMAIAGTSAAQARGLHVPDDLSVTGFDDTAISGYLRPPLTTVRTDAVAWGRAAAQCLLQLVDGNTCPDVLLPPPELVLRASTAPPQSAPAIPSAIPRVARPGPPARPAPQQKRIPHEHQEDHHPRTQPGVRAQRRSLRGRRRRRRRRSDATSATGPIKIWLSNNPEEIAWGEEMVDAWNAEHPDEEITAQEIPAGKSSEEVIGAAITAGNAPCLVFNTSPAAVPQFQKQGGLVALDSFPDGKEYVEERTGDAAEQYQSPDGQYYQLPWKANPVMIFYNKDLMKKAGVDPENPPLATYDEFLATSEKIVSSGAAEAAIWPAPSSEFYQSWFDFYPLFAAETGGTQLVEDGKATFNSPEGQAVAEFWKTMYDEGYSQNEKYNGDSFADGKAAMAIVGPWAIAVYGEDINWGAAPVPTSGGTSAEETYTFSDAKNVAIYSACEAQGTAWEVLKFATSEEQDGSLLENTGQMPMRDGRRGGVPRLLRGQPGLPDLRRAGGPDGRGAQRGQQHRDLADLPRRATRSR